MAKKGFIWRGSNEAEIKEKWSLHCGDPGPLIVCYVASS